MSADYFAPFDTVRYEGPDSVNDLAYRWYDKDRVVLGKRMEDHLRVAVCFWHTFCWPGSDVFGAGTFSRPWHARTNDAAAAKAKREAALAFVEKLDVPFYCFHDVDVMADAGDIAAFRRSFAEAVDHLETLQARHGRKLLWGTANLFGHPRYMAGAATNPDPEVYAWAASQVRDALEATHRLGGANYVLWGGREGYDTILNTEIGIEQENFGRFLNLVVEHKHRIGFTGTILIEPKPHEPTKHQYDFDTQTVFGSIDANRGDHQNGWDTDQFPNSVEELTLALLEIVRAGGFTTGGFNFDAKVRRQSIDAADLFHGHIGGIDTLAHALIQVEAILKDGQVDAFRKDRYAGWQGELGQAIHAPDATLASVADLAVARDLKPQPRSGRQEWLENMVNRF